MVDGFPCYNLSISLLIMVKVGQEQDFRENRGRFDNRQIPQIFNKIAPF